MRKNIFISNPDSLAKTIKAMRMGGAGNLHILADFDHTLTRGFYNGIKVPAIIAILRNDRYLTQNYADSAQTLADYYKKRVSKPNTSRQMRSRLHKEWWIKHYALLVKSRLNVNDIYKIIQSDQIVIREGVKQFVQLINRLNVPMIIISAAGLGKESIQGVFEHNQIDTSGIDIISNQLLWDKDGYMTGYKEPIVHGSNKDEAVLKEFPFYEQIKNRHNVILLGDGIDDVLMLGNSKHQNVLKIGFLYSYAEKNIDEYQKAYDVVITNDGDMSYVTDLINKII